jgi:hypothetical protein
LPPLLVLAERVVTGREAAGRCVLLGYSGRGLPTATACHARAREQIQSMCTMLVMMIYQYALQVPRGDGCPGSAGASAPELALKPPVRNCEQLQQRNPHIATGNLIHPRGLSPSYVPVQHWHRPFHAALAGCRCRFPSATRTPTSRSSSGTTTLRSSRRMTWILVIEVMDPQS